VTWDGAPCIDVLAQTGVDLWWPDEAGNYTDPDAAIRICRTCHFQTPCISEGMREPAAPTGIWGGMKFRDGRLWRAIGAKR